MNPYWPLFDLRIRTGDLELRYATDEDAVAQARLAGTGIHDPATMPFTIPWTRRESPELERKLIQHHWECRSKWQPEDWKLIFAIYLGDTVIGSQTMSSTQFPVRRVVETGSWLGAAHQGKGLGRQMRTAVLALAFGELGAEHAVSDVYDDNIASLKLNERLGYEQHWGDVDEVEGLARPFTRFHLTREQWTERVKTLFEVEIVGMDACLSMFGLPDTTV